jgi:hypothetical protein
VLLCPSNTVYRNRHGLCPFDYQYTFKFGNCRFDVTEKNVTTWGEYSLKNSNK